MLVFAIGFAINMNAQTASYNLSVAHATLTNTDTAYLYTPGITTNSDLTFKLTQTKTSGTVAGVGLLQGSITGGAASNWFSMGSDGQASKSSQFQDTATITNGTASYYWQLPKVKATYQYYRIRVITSGTQVSVSSGSVYTYKKS